MTQHSARPGSEPQSSYGEVFANSEFRVMWAAQALSLLGNQLAQVAIAVLAYDRTHSAFLTALAYAFTYLPPIVGGPLLSGLADMFPRRNVMIFFDLLRVVFVCAMAVPHIPFWVLCALIIATTLSGVPFTAARTALLPDVLPGDRLALGSAIGNITDQLSQVIGFTLGAVAVAWADPHHALLLDALSFIVSAVLVGVGVLRRPVPPHTHEGPSSLWSSARLGARLAMGPAVPRLLVLFGWLSGLYVLPEALAAPYAHALGKGTIAVGLLMAATPVGTVLGALVLIRLIPPARRRALLGWLAMLACAPLIGTAANPSLPVVLALWALAGVGSAYQVIAAATFLQRLPNSGRGTAFGFVSSGLLAAQGLGFLIGGAAAQAFGPPHVIAVAGAVGLCAAAILTIAWARVRPDAEPPAMPTEIASPTRSANLEPAAAWAFGAQTAA